MHDVGTTRRKFGRVAGAGKVLIVVHRRTTRLVSAERSGETVFVVVRVAGLHTLAEDVSDVGADVFVALTYAGGVGGTGSSGATGEDVGEGEESRENRNAHWITSFFRGEKLDETNKKTYSYLSMTKDDIDIKFWSRVDKSKECWEWQGYCKPIEPGKYTQRYARVS